MLAPSMGQGQPPLTSGTQRTSLGVALTPWCLYTSVAEVSRTQRSGTMSPTSILDSWIADKCLLECVFSKRCSGAYCVPGHTWGAANVFFRRAGGRGGDLYILLGLALLLSLELAAYPPLMGRQGSRLKHAIPAPPATGILRSPRGTSLHRRSVRQEHSLCVAFVQLMELIQHYMRVLGFSFFRKKQPDNCRVADSLKYPEEVPDPVPILKRQH